MSRYTRGANFERDVVKYLEKLGYLAFRCAGSKGNQKVDVVALSLPYQPMLNPANSLHRVNRDLLIQCKTSGAISQFERETLKQAAKKYGCIALLASKSEDKKVKFEVLK